MKEYVDALVPELIAQERARDLEKRLAGLHQVLNSYNRTSYGVQQKGQYFTSFLSLLPYFVPMGTLTIVALQEQYLYYQKIYNEADPDKAKHLEDLQDAITKYSKRDRDLLARRSPPPDVNGSIALQHHMAAENPRQPGLAPPDAWVPSHYKRDRKKAKGRIHLHKVPS
jgi:hypothetical protein